ncbi:Protein kinase [uncultured virus]|nr:Protein kinase [uncultured virus]
MQKIGSYEFSLDKQYLLGEGSFSTVYLGKYIGQDNKYIKNNTYIAIKIINKNSLTPNGNKIIDDEMEIMNIIKNNPHPNIVECYDVIKTPNNVYIIMEYCDSGDLRTIIRKPIQEKFIQFYFSQLANGLKFLNCKGIIHRDIKPKNILLTNQNRILKIADFGFAKLSQEHDLYETICGSPLYMAPEMLKHLQYNKQTDLWSIGMILYEMLYGTHPFHNCKSIPELKNIIETIVLDIPPNNNRNKQVSKECLNLLKMLLQKDVTRRINWDDFFDHTWINKLSFQNNDISIKSDKSNPTTSLVEVTNVENLDYSAKLNIINNYYDNYIKTNKSICLDKNLIDKGEDEIFQFEYINS